MIALSPAGLALLKRFEGLGDGDKATPGLQPYLDAAGKPTIGYGHLILPGENFAAGISNDQAEALLHEDSGKAVAILSGTIRRPLRQNEADALISFTFNVGRRDTVIALVNASDNIGAAKLMLQYDRAAGMELLGLLRRRLAEAGMYLGL